MKIMFLDFDGVLNGFLLRKVHMHDGPDLHPNLVELVNRIIRATNAKIVISSSWRNNEKFSFDKVVDALRYAGFIGDIIGRTPTLTDFHSAREDEIDMWLAWRQQNKEAEPIESFVILDDIPMVRMKDSAIETSCEYGIVEADVERAIAILNR